jgi:uncharacterized protein
MGAGPELFQAIRAGDAARVREIVTADGGLVNARNPQGQSAVLAACYMGRKEIRDLLVERGANLELHEAAAAGKLSRVKELVESKPELAVASGHAVIAKWLAENGADVNYRYAKGYSPLLTAAAANGHLEIVKTLLEHGAELHARTEDGKNALQFAEERGHKEVPNHLRGLGLT